MNATLRNIQRVIADHGGKARVRHHLGDTFIVVEAKALGFGTNKPMVRFDRGGWTIIDPDTWAVSPVQ